MISAGMLQKQFEQFDTTCPCCATVMAPGKTMMSHTNDPQKVDKNHCWQSLPTTAKKTKQTALV